MGNADGVRDARTAPKTGTALNLMTRRDHERKGIEG
jgi:hypothetical protein